MTLTLMAIISGTAFGMAIAALVVGTLAYAKIVGMEKSTHKIQWMPVPAPTGGLALNDMPEHEIGDGNEMQDLPKGMAKKGPKTLKQQMQEFMYPDVDEEQV